MVRSDPVGSGRVRSDPVGSGRNPTYGGPKTSGRIRPDQVGIGACTGAGKMTKQQRNAVFERRGAFIKCSLLFLECRL